MVKRTGVTVDIFSGYDTAQNGDIDEEVALIESTYENVKVSGRNQAHRRLRIPLESERRPGCRVTLVINIVPGYPYVLPGISLIFADSKDAEQLSAEEVAQIKTEVNETIQPCLSAGMPCILSIVSVVSGVLDNGVPVKAEAVAPRKAGSGGVATSPSLTPLPLRSKDARRLSLLTLHLLQKCCYMKESESREEANDVFEKLSRHLMHDIQLFPAEMKSFHRWNSAQFADDFRDEISDVFGPNADDPLKKWLWEDVGNAIKLQAGSEGRYAREFIEQQQLGAGSFAPVFVCRKKVDGRLYAIKKVAMRAKETQKVIGEVQTLSAFNHKNVVRYYDAWVEDGCDDDLRQFIESSGSESETDEDSQSDESTYSLSKSSDASTDLDEEAADEDSSLSSTTRSDHYQTLYIQMELCSGRSLRHLLDECNSQAGGIFNAVNGEKAAASVLRQLLRVTAHTHLENIAHRDLKPENVLLELNAHQDTGEIGTIRVADFGLARVVQSSCRRMASCLELSEAETPLALPEAGGTCGSESRGTVLYAAPEQEQGRSYGLKVDEFAIGMIAVEMWLAVAGKDFRERPSIMANIWRTGELPEWFSTWNPLIAAVISRLINADPAKRDSAEEVLKTANLPGDPVELSEALDIIDMYGEQMYGRVIQRIAQRTTDHYRKPPPKLCEEINFLGSAKCMEAVQAAHSVGMLHGCCPLEIYDPLVLTNPRLRSMGFDTHIDAKGRCFCHADTAQLSIAAFVGMQEHMIEPFYQFYHKARPFVTFTSPQPHEEPDVESHLEPLLCALHLLSTVEPAPSTITLIISHASWLNAVHPPEVGSRSPPTEMQRLKSVVDSAEKVAAAVSQIATVLASHGLPAAPRRDDFMRLVSTAIVELLRPMASAFHLNCSVVIDPGWIPDERLVMRAAVQTGLLIGLSTASTGDVAVGVSLDNFLSQCWVSKKAVKNAFSVTVDLKAPLMANQRFQLPDRDSIHMDGVALRSKDGLPYTTMATTAIQLWSGGIVACIRAEISSIHFKETLKAVRIRWILWDGRYITSSRQFDKNVVKGEQLSLDDVRAAVRRLGTSATADDKSNGGKLGDPLFLCGAVDTKSHSRIVELFTSVWGSKASPPLVVDAGVAEVDALIRRMEVDDRNVDLPASSGGGMPELLQWLRQNSSCGIVGIYSLADGRLVFFAHPRRVRAVTQPNKDKGSTKKKSHR